MASSSEEDSEPTVCFDKAHIFDPDSFLDRHFDPEEEIWFECDLFPCPHRYNSVESSIYPTWKHYLCQIWQEFREFALPFVQEGYSPPYPNRIPLPGTPDLPPVSPAEELSEFLVYPEEPSDDEAEVEGLLSFLPEVSDELSFFDFHILTSTAMSDPKDTSVPILRKASDYANWAGAMRGYLTFLEAWPAISPGDDKAADYAKHNAHAQGAIIMRTV